MERDGSPVTRRGLLAGTAGSLAALAGCGDVGPPGEDGDGGGGVVFRKPLAVTSGGVPTQQANLNPWAGTNTYDDAIELAFDPLAIYDRENDSYVPALATDWTLDGDSILIDLDDRYVWTNGDPVTARDVSLHLWLETLLVRPLSDRIADWEVKDDHSIEVVRANPDRNRSVFLQRFLPTHFHAPRAAYADVVETLRNNDPDSETYRDTLEELTQGILDADELIADGPFLPQVRSRNAWAFDPNPDHPRADQNEVDRVIHEMVGDSEVEEAEGLADGTLDAVTLQQFRNAPTHLPDFAVQAIEETRRGEAMYFNQDREPWDDHRVRRALGLLVDTGTISRNMAPTIGRPARRACGLPPRTMAYTWLGEDYTQLTDYRGTDPEGRATELLRAAGYERRDGDWYQPDGERFSIELVTPGDIPYNDPFNTLRSELPRQGVEANVRSENRRTFNEEVWQARDFGVVGLPIGAGLWHPLGFYRGTFLESGSGDITGAARTYDVPATVGDPDGATERVDAPALVEELEHATEEEREREIALRLAWLHNQRLPLRTITLFVSHCWYNGRDWNLPEVENPRFPPAVYSTFSDERLLARGEITPDTETR